MRRLASLAEGTVPGIAAVVGGVAIMERSIPLLPAPSPFVRIPQLRHGNPDSLYVVELDMYLAIAKWLQLRGASPRTKRTPMTFTIMPFPCTGGSGTVPAARPIRRIVSPGCSIIVVRETGKVTKPA